MASIFIILEYFLWAFAILLQLAVSDFGKCTEVCQKESSCNSWTFEEQGQVCKITFESQSKLDIAFNLTEETSVSPALIMDFREEFKSQFTSVIFDSAAHTNPGEFPYLVQVFRQLNMKSIPVIVIDASKTFQEPQNSFNQSQSQESNSTVSLNIVLSDSNNIQQWLQNKPNEAFDQSIVWLMKAPDPQSVLSKVPLQANSLFYTLYNVNSSDVEILEVYKIKEGQDLKTNIVGSWNNKAGLTFSEDVIWERRKDLDGLVFSTASEHDPPYLNLIQDQQGEMFLSGLIYDVWVELAQRCNFTFTVVRSIDGAWGSKQSDGSMNGIVGMIGRNEVYIGLTSFGMSLDRQQVVDYLSPFGALTCRLYFRDDGLGNGARTYLNPFHYTTWLLIFATFFASSLAYQMTTSGRKDPSLFIMFHCLVSQGYYEEPPKMSSKIVFLTLFFFGILNYAAYSARLTALLAVKEFTLPFHDKASFLHESSYNIVTLPGTLLVSYFQYGDALAKEIFRTRLVYADSVEQGFQQIAEHDNKAFFWIKTSMDFITKTTCEYKTIPAFNFEVVFSIVIKKGSPYKEILNHQLRQMKERGIFDKLEHVWYPGEKICNEGSAETLGMNMVYTIFVFFGCAFALSFIVMICECLIGRGRRLIFRQREKYWGDNVKSPF